MSAPSVGGGRRILAKQRISAAVGSQASTKGRAETAARAMLSAMSSAVGPDVSSVDAPQAPRRIRDPGERGSAKQALEHGATSERSEYKRALGSRQQHLFRAKSARILDCTALVRADDARRFGISRRFGVPRGLRTPGTISRAERTTPGVRASSTTRRVSGLPSAASIGILVSGDVHGNGRCIVVAGLGSQAVGTSRATAPRNAPGSQRLSSSR